MKKDSTLRILDESGDTVIKWNIANEEATAIAEAAFNRERSLGSQLIETNEGKGSRNVQTFNKLAEDIVAIPSFAGG